jgi:D-arabinose 1-dehydrogenase-like Zn-dependent alcohol dehydrogenase
VWAATDPGDDTDAFMTGHGGWAEYALASASYVGKVPDGIDPFEAAPLTCAGVTTYKAVKVSGARSSDLVAIFGIGGLGHLALQYAVIAGAQVVAVDLFDEKLALAKELGAAYTVNAREQDPAAAIKALGGADAAISLAVAPKAFEQAYGSLRRGGTLVFVGLPADNYIQLPIFETVLNGEGARLDRRHQDRPARGLRAARRGKDRNRLRAAPAGGCQPGDPRSGDGAGQGQARL